MPIVVARFPPPAVPFEDREDVTSVLVPVALTASHIVSITANGVALPEDGTPAWAGGTTYAAGARVHSAATHRVYESVKDGNLAHDPADPTNRVTATGAPTWWVDIGPTNRWAMFDSFISSQTAAASPLVITMRPGAFNGIALFLIEADGLAVTVRSSPGGTLIYSQTDTLEGSEPPDYYEYFFQGSKPRTQFTATGLDAYSASEIQITLTKQTGPVKLGMLVVGDLRALGVPERGVRVSPKTYSYIADDAFGNTRIVRRPSATGITIPVRVEHGDADIVIQTVQDLLDVPVAVIGSNDLFHTKLSTFGLISGDMDYSTWPHRMLNLTVKGFI